MRKLIETAYDDITAADTDELVPATHLDVTITFDGESRVLDLSDESYELIAKTLEPFMAIGAKLTYKGTRYKTGTRVSQDRRPNEYYIRLRAWAETEHIPIPVDSQGKPGYSPSLKAQFDAHEKGQPVK